jgi:hypothetical protein
LSQRGESLKKAPVVPFVLLVWVLSLPVPSAVAKEIITEEQAIEILSTQIGKDKVYDSWTTLACLSFMTERATKSYFDVGVHEKHGGKCPGDPSTYPIVDRFRVNRKTGKIQWYDTAMELRTYDAFLHERAIKKK